MRGPRPWKLSKLFKLQYEEGIRDTDILVKRMRVSRKTLYTYRWRLKRRLQKLVKKSLHDFDGRLVCPECLDLSLVEDRETGEFVCTKCGLVTRQTQNFSLDLPFSTTYALTSHIAFGKSLGSFSNREIFRVLARASCENGQIPIRQITTITQNC